MFLKAYWFYLFVFAVASLLRFVPELFSSVYPAGCDIPFYIYELKIMERGLSLDQLYFGNPFPYFVLLLVHAIVRVDWFLLFKFFTPLLNGFVAVAFLYFLRNGLDLGWKKHEYVLATVLLVFSASGMIMSNSIIKQQFAMIFLFLFFVAYRLKDVKQELLFAVLVVLCHQIISLLLFALLVVLCVYGWVRHEESRRDVLVLLSVVLVSVGYVTFVLPCLGSANFVEELTMHVSSYLNTNSYGFSSVVTPILDYVWRHFIFYFGLWIGFIIFGYSRFFRERLVNVLLLVILPLSFIPIGTFWTRFQWLLVYPFVIIFVGGTKRVKALRYVFVLFVIVNGCSLLVDMDWSIPRSSVPFDSIANIRGNYDLIANDITNNTLIIDSIVGLVWTKLYLLDSNKSAIVLSERTISFFVENDSLCLFRDGIKGHDFYDYRVNSFEVCLDSFDNVFVVNVGSFVANNPFDGFWQYFIYYGEYNGEAVYAYWRPT